jgi:NADH pyrophosphatase NudC (nudix superfamily)
LQRVVDAPPTDFEGNTLENESDLSWRSVFKTHWPYAAEDDGKGPKCQKCAVCAGNIAADARFCGHCGTAVQQKSVSDILRDSRITVKIPLLLAPCEVLESR